MKLFKLIPGIRKRLHLEYRLILWQVIRRLRKSVTISTNQGIFTPSLNADDPIERELFCRGEYELDLLLNTVSFLQKIKKCDTEGNGTLLDIGANTGVISIGMIYTGRMKKAIAIEPEPRNFSLLQKNIEQNKLKEKMFCLPFAVSDHKSEIEFELSETNFGDHRVRRDFHISENNEIYNESQRRVIKVESDQLDNLLQDVPQEFKNDISLIWIDVQGYEGFVFLGAKQLLSNDIPVVSEIWPYGIRRTGMSQEQFCNICRKLWSYYWVLRRGRFVKYPIDILDIFFDELGYDGNFDNVIFTK